MKFHDASISDILRCSQKDEAYVKELENDVAEVMKYVIPSKFNVLREYVPLSAKALYYGLTSLSKLQTLGEEYTGIIRVADKDMPTTAAQLIWLALNLSGEKVFDKLLLMLEKEVQSNKNLLSTAKSTILKSIVFIKENKHILNRLHQSLFYIFGKYYTIPTRLSGIGYVMLRRWMQDTSADASFNALGKMSMLYLIVLLTQKSITAYKDQNIPVTENSSSSTSSNICVLCAETCKNICATACGHLFCWDCIYESLKYQSSCPICRETVNASRIVLLQNYA